MAGGSQPAGNTTTTSTTTPWAGQQPYLEQGFSEAQRLYNSGGPQYFPGATVASMSPQTSQAISNEFNRGINGSPVVNAADSATVNGLGTPLTANPGNALYTSAAGMVNPATAYATSLANGSDVNDPYLQAQIAATNGDITRAYQTATAPQVDSSFEGSGRFGSGASALARGTAQTALAGQLGEADTNLLNTAYEAAKDRQTQGIGLLGQLGQNAATNTLAAGQGISGNYTDAGTNQARLAAIAPSLAGADVQDLALQQDAGSQLDQYDQALLNSQIQQYNYNQLLPYQNLQTYLQMIQGNYGGQTVTQQPYYNSGTSALGGALTGAMAGGMLGPMLSTSAMAGPIGLGAGALLGLGMGLSR